MLYPIILCFIDDLFKSLYIGKLQIEGGSNVNIIHGGPEKDHFVLQASCFFLFGAGVFGNCFSTFAYCMLGQFARQEESHSSLDLPGGDRGTFVVVCQSRCLGGDTLENIVDKAIHDTHRFAGDAGVGVHLFEYFVNVDSVALLPPPLFLLVSLADVLLGLTGFLHSFPTYFRWHIFVSECKSLERKNR